MDANDVHLPTDCGQGWGSAGQVFSIVVMIFPEINFPVRTTLDLVACAPPDGIQVWSLSRRRHSLTVELFRLNAEGCFSGRFTFSLIRCSERLFFSLHLFVAFKKEAGCFCGGLR